MSLEFRNDFEDLVSKFKLSEESFGVAVSGGSDSVALLMLLAPWAHKNNKKIFVVTVDHGLRSAAADEALYVQRLCQKNNLQHEILKIESIVSGNIQAWARDNRYQVISEWAHKNKIRSVFLGHTQDDQAETVLLRLGRGSGVDGLAAMQPESLRENIKWLRPLLNIQRNDLREFLKFENIAFVDDPSNDDMKFHRIKIRNFLANTNEFGLNAKRLTETASRMAQARDVLNQVAFEFAKENMLVTKIGSLTVDLSNFHKQLPETKFRVLSYAVKWVTGNHYGARAKTLEKALIDSLDGKVRTFSGCMLTKNKEKLHIFREYNAVKNSPLVSSIWDNKWLVPENSHVRACGLDGLHQIENWKSCNLPKQALVSMPTIWENSNLVDHLAFENKDSSIKLIKQEEDFYSGILSY